MSSVDVYIGARIRRTREFRSVAIENIAAAVGVKSSDMEGYEGGQLHIPAIHLVAIAEYLDIYPVFFFKGLPGASQHVKAFQAELLLSLPSLRLAIPPEQIDEFFPLEEICELIASAPFSRTSH